MKLVCSVNGWNENCDDHDDRELTQLLMLPLLLLFPTTKYTASAKLLQL